jgi:hypothetical protein
MIKIKTKHNMKVTNMRRKTNSITDLVKIVAEEVATEVAEKVFDKKMKDWRLETDSIKREITNAGQIWSEEEDDWLEAEMDAAIKQIAHNHKRTVLSIQCRMLKHLKGV